MSNVARIQCEIKNELTLKQLRKPVQQINTMNTYRPKFHCCSNFLYCIYFYFNTGTVLWGNNKDFHSLYSRTLSNTKFTVSQNKAVLLQRGKPRDAAVNHWRYRMYRQVFVSFDTRDVTYFFMQHP